MKNNKMEIVLDWALANLRADTDTQNKNEVAFAISVLEAVKRETACIIINSCLFA